ncbi:O-antigen ligase family protein [Cereibacter sphaeroides]|uniref:O-antigen ligase family protein n=1 Tax=Cereibacter sphaeroides TaxID=1063 RepID=UPI001F200301|nr:O-antigen ligase family protein [Cereibacter sphaeroides]MCE6950230.1 O-antigen ligase family protein [Cereibacter sphaeroides]MCE6958654.1 O-antigen ligase family protein [Cereibacter sphaeroides]MCE6973463.1 O-antigen ligase family protein [Cereibacter sphaeroides]
MVTLYLFCVVVSIYAYIGPLYLNTLRAMLLVLVIPLGVRLLLGHFGRLIITDALFVAFFLWSVVALAVNNPEAVVQQSGSTGAEFLGGYFVGRAYIRSRGAFLALCRQLALWVIFLVPFGIIEAKTGNPGIPNLIRQLTSLQSVPDVNIPGRMGLNRVQNAFTHPIHYGLFCSVAFSLNFIALKGETGTLWRWISSMLISLGCLLALSSGALLALMMQIGLIGWSVVLRKVAWRWWLLVGLLVLAYIAIDLLSNRTPIRVFLSYATFSAHTAYWRSLIFEYGFQNALDNPLFGIGMKDWVRPSWMYGDSMDNFWLVIAVRFGFPAAILIIVGYLYVLLKVIFRNLQTDPELWKIRQAWVLSFVGLTFTLCTVHIWSNVYSFVIFMFASGVWLIYEPVRSAEKPAEDAAPNAPPNRPRHLPFSRFSA